MTLPRTSPCAYRALNGSIQTPQNRKQNLNITPILVTEIFKISGHLPSEILPQISICCAFRSAATVDLVRIRTAGPQNASITLLRDIQTLDSRIQAQNIVPCAEDLMLSIWSHSVQVSLTSDWFEFEDGFNSRGCSQFQPVAQQTAQHFKFESSCDFSLSFRFPCKAKPLSAAVSFKVEPLHSIQVRRIPSRDIQFKVDGWLQSEFGVAVNTVDRRVIEGGNYRYSIRVDVTMPSRLRSIVARI
ncbi:hypothetical protein C8R43DRAFT_1116660 [Mycena crocata]|nr:hypothetical protein C8R43DRAFT_1116660 [Mycena crocata]